jgi:hypothetical protein
MASGLAGNVSSSATPVKRNNRPSQREQKMSIEAEYEEGVAFEEPEHPDRRVLDRFFERLGEGDLSGAAEELRALHAAGGKLCRRDVELLANLLDGSAFGIAFPYQLRFAKRGRGRPKRALQSQPQAPWNAFARGDEIEASKALNALRNPDDIAGIDVGTLAALLGDDPAIHEHFPWKLVLKCPRRGKPKAMSTVARQFWIASMVRKARIPPKQMKQAVWEVCNQTGLSTATVYKAVNAMR